VRSSTVASNGTVGLIRDRCDGFPTTILVGVSDEILNFHLVAQSACRLPNPMLEFCAIRRRSQVQIVGPYASGHRYILNGHNDSRVCVALARRVVTITTFGADVAWLEPGTEGSTANSWATPTEPDMPIAKMVANTVRRRGAFG